MKRLVYVCMFCLMFCTTAFANAPFTYKYENDAYLIDINGEQFEIYQYDDYDGKDQDSLPFTYSFSEMNVVEVKLTDKAYVLKPKPKAAPKPKATRRSIVIHDGQPFDMEYLGNNIFIVHMEGTNYKIQKHDKYDGDDENPYPFTYQFEPDGDVDINHHGHRYDIDNPDDDFADAIEDLFDTSSGKKKTLYKKEKIYVKPGTTVTKTTVITSTTLTKKEQANLKKKMESKIKADKKKADKKKADKKKADALRKKKAADKKKAAAKKRQATAAKKKKKKK